MQIIWPIVDLNAVEDILNSRLNDDFQIVHDTTAMLQEDYERKALDVTILADTVIINDHVNFHNLKSFKINARKLFTGVKNSSNGGKYIVSFETIATSRFEWFAENAPPPGADTISTDGNDGKDGAPGFPATLVHVEVGCIIGEPLVQFEIKPGEGQNAQGASDGLPGNNGISGNDVEVLGKCEPGCHTCASVKMVTLIMGNM